MGIDMNNPRVRLALEIREKIQPVEFDGRVLQAMAIGGSVSRGKADAYSDLQLLCFWDMFPDMDTRNSFVAAIGADRMSEIDEDNNEDTLVIGDIQVDVTHNGVDYYDALISDTWEFHLADYQTLGFLDTISHAYILFGEEILGDWKEKAAEYPRELAVNVIYDNLQELTNGNIELFIQRDNPTEFYARIIDIQHRLFNILSAINDSYSGGYKWMYAELEEMSLVPVNIVGRFKAMFEGSRLDVVEDLYSIVFEVLYLVNHSFPEMDFNVQEAFDKFMVKRLPLEA